MLSVSLSGCLYSCSLHHGLKQLDHFSLVLSLPSCLLMLLQTPGAVTLNNSGKRNDRKYCPGIQTIYNIAWTHPRNRQDQGRVCNCYMCSLEVLFSSTRVSVPSLSVSLSLTLSLSPQNVHIYILMYMYSPNGQFYWIT